MSIVSIGDFTVDLKERRVFAADTELTVEPKVVDVLCYLIEHNSRYVSLAELHDNVWAGRVVTDTAVRRTISKLRVLLDDTDAENPQYIKSQMKRGYQLTCTVTPLAESIAEPVSDNLPGRSITASGWKRPVLPLLAMIAILLLCYLGFQLLRQAPPSMVAERALLSVPGNKTSYTMSKDGRWHAFVGKVDDNRSWELFLYDNTVGQLQKIATAEGDIRFAGIVDNDSKLAYILYKDDHSYLYTQSLLNLSEPAVLHPTPDFKMLALPLPLAENQLLIAAGKEQLGNIHYYKYDMLKHSFEQFTYSDRANIQDAFASISPDQKLLALGRADIDRRKVSLQLYRLVDKELIADYPLQNDLEDFRLAWVDNDTLLIRSNLTHELVRLSDGARQQVSAAPYPLHEFHFAANGDLYGLDYRLQRRNTYQASWPFTDNFDKSFQFGPEVTAVWFSTDSKYLWLRTREDNETRLYRYYPADNQRQLVFASTEYLFITDQSADGELLLLKHNNRYEIYNTATAHTIAVTISTQNVHSANFTADEQAVIFSEKVQTGWQTKRFDLATKKQSVVLTDYQYLTEAADGYVAATPDGEVWLLDSLLNRRQLLNQIYLLDYSYDFQVRDDQLIMVHRDLMGDWNLNHINLITLEQWQRKIPYYDFSLNYSVDAKAQNLIYMTLSKQENQLVKYSYDFAGK